MSPEMPQDMREAQALGISFFAGEAEEGRFDEVLRDAWNGMLAPLYNHMDKLPNLQGEPPPILPRKHIRRTSGSLSSMDLGRGRPYLCSFCTIINVQGRKSRFRSPNDLEKIVRENYAQSIRRLFITDDNFARNRDWELLFDRLIELRAGDCPKIGCPVASGATLRTAVTKRRNGALSVVSPFGATSTRTRARSASVSFRRPLKVSGTKMLCKSKEFGRDYKKPTFPSSSPLTPATQSVSRGVLLGELRCASPSTTVARMEPRPVLRPVTKLMTRPGARRHAFRSSKIDMPGLGTAMTRRSRF